MIKACARLPACVRMSEVLPLYHYENSISFLQEIWMVKGEHIATVSICLVLTANFTFVGCFTNFQIYLICLLARCIPVVSIVYICLIRILALRPPVLQFKLPALLLVCVFFALLSFLLVVLSGEPRQKHGRGLVDHKLVQAPQ